TDSVDVNFLEHHRWIHVKPVGTGKVCPATAPEAKVRTCDACQCDFCFAPQQDLRRAQEVRSGGARLDPLTNGSLRGCKRRRTWMDSRPWSVAAGERAVSPLPLRTSSHRTVGPDSGGAASSSLSTYCRNDTAVLGWGTSTSRPPSSSISCLATAAILSDVPRR